MKAKKLLAVLVVLTLVIALAVPAFAATVTNGTITINSPEDITGRTFDAYQLFSVTTTSGTSENMTFNYVATDLLKAALTDGNATDIVATGKSNEELVDAVRTYLNASNANKPLLA